MIEYITLLTLFSLGSIVSFYLWITPKQRLQSGTKKLPGPKGSCVIVAFLSMLKTMRRSSMDWPSAQDPKTWRLVPVGEMGKNLWPYLFNDNYGEHSCLLVL
jgi:hypothetical protein